jgi:hypothetical protein
MSELPHRLIHALRGGAWWWGVALSVLLFVGSLVLVTAVVVSWSADHFRSAGRGPFMGQRHPIVRAVALLAKNLTGVVLIALGIVMALPGVPGQGLLTALIGITMVDFPGKRPLERRLIGRPAILKAVNRLRTRFHKPVLELD